MKATMWVVGAVLAAATAGIACASGNAATAPAGAVAVANETLGRFVWHDLVTGDAVVSRTFYHALLGWDFESTTRNGHPYLVARFSGQLVGGIVEREEMKDRPAAWLAYLSVSDLEGAVAKAAAAGGKVLFPPTPVGAYGRVAVVLDPQGAPLGLAGVTASLPAEPSQPPLNRFFWMEYLAKDGPAALAFYKDLGGYESTVTTSAHGIDYNVLKRQRSRAGLLQMPPALANVEPNWLPYVRVEDPAALATRARVLGGRVLIEARADVRKGTLAVIADPTGGALALQKWPL